MSLTSVWQFSYAGWLCVYFGVLVFYRFVTKMNGRSGGPSSGGSSVKGTFQKGKFRYQLESVRADFEGVCLGFGLSPEVAVYIALQVAFLISGFQAYYFDRGVKCGVQTKQHKFAPRYQNSEALDPRFSLRRLNLRLRVLQVCEAQLNGLDAKELLLQTLVGRVARYAGDAQKRGYNKTVDAAKRTPK